LNLEEFPLVDPRFRAKGSIVFTIRNGLTNEIENFKIPTIKRYFRDRFDDHYAQEFVFGLASDPLTRKDILDGFRKKVAETIKLPEQLFTMIYTSGSTGSAYENEGPRWKKFGDEDLEADQDQDNFVKFLKNHNKVTVYPVVDPKEFNAMSNQQLQSSFNKIATSLWTKHQDFGQLSKKVTGLLKLKQKSSGTMPQLEEDLRKLGEDLRQASEIATLNTQTFSAPKQNGTNCFDTIQPTFAKTTEQKFGYLDQAIKLAEGALRGHQTSEQVAKELEKASEAAKQARIRSVEEAFGNLHSTWRLFQRSKDDIIYDTQKQGGLTWRFNDAKSIVGNFEILEKKALSSIDSIIVKMEKGMIGYLQVALKGNHNLNISSQPTEESIEQFLTHSREDAKAVFDLFKTDLSIIYENHIEQLIDKNNLRGAEKVFQQGEEMRLFDQVQKNELRSRIQGRQRRQERANDERRRQDERQQRFEEKKTHQQQQQRHENAHPFQCRDECWIDRRDYKKGLKVNSIGTPECFGCLFGDYLSVKGLVLEPNAKKAAAEYMKTLKVYELAGLTDAENKNIIRKNQDDEQYKTGLWSRIKKNYKRLTLIFHPDKMARDEETQSWWQPTWNLIEKVKSEIESQRYFDDLKNKDFN
jgi:hypothetical protein